MFPTSPANVVLCINNSWKLLKLFCVSIVTKIIWLSANKSLDVVSHIGSQVKYILM